MDVVRVTLHLGRRHEAKMVVAVRGLRLAARIYHIDLRGHLVVRTEPRFAHQRQHIVRIVCGERFGRPQAEFFERIPNAIVGTGFREVIAAGTSAGVLLGDDVVEDGGSRIDDRRIGERPAQDDNAGTAQQRPDPFRAQRAAALRLGDGLRNASQSYTNTFDATSQAAG